MAGVFVPENYRRVQLSGVDPADLVSRHEKEVSAFSTERGRGVVAATLQQAADVEAACDRLILPRLNQVNAQQTIGLTFGGTVLLMLALPGLGGGAVTWVELAIAICTGAAVCEATVRLVVRKRFRTLASATHSASSGPPPIRRIGREGEEPEAPRTGTGMRSTARTALLWVTTVIFFVIFWQVLNHRMR